MATRSSRTTHPAVSQQIEQMLRARNIDYDFVPDVRLADIRETEGNQVRVTEHRAPRDQVDRYAVAMKHGAQFPAVLLNDRLEKIDGNTRVEARTKNGEDTIPAYVCHGMSQLEERALSVEINQSNGLAMTKPELRRFITGAMQEGVQPDVKGLARMTGVKEATIKRWIADTEFTAHAQKVGIEDTVVAVLPESTRAALQAVRLEPVFEQLTRVAAEARISAGDVRKLVAQVNGASSEAAALAIVDAERHARADDIRAVASGFKPGVRRSSGSAQHLGGLARFDVDDLLDVAPDKQYETFTRIKLIRDRLDAVVARAEREWELTPPADESNSSSTGATAMAA